MRRKRPSPNLPIVHPLKDHGENDPSKTPVENPQNENISSVSSKTDQL